MSSSQSSSPVVQPMHNPDQAAQVQLPQAPLGTTAGGKPLSGQKALLAKKFAASNNPSTVSPTDNMMTPVSAKLNQAKKKHFNKAVNKPLSLAALAGSDDDDDDDKKTAPGPDMVAME